MDTQYPVYVELSQQKALQLGWDDFDLGDLIKEFDYEVAKTTDTKPNHGKFLLPTEELPDLEIDPEND